MNKDQYNKLLKENITKTYKKADCNVQATINGEAKQIAEKLKLDDKIECLAERNAFISLKDHKEDFHRNTKCRLINPAKSEIGRLSKKYLERINTDVRKATQLNQWRNTATVIDWFSDIKGKQRSKFIKFDIVEFYPSISEDLLNKALDFAEKFTSISPEERSTIMHARKSLLLNPEAAWKKKDQEDLFDVTMGSLDGAEVCEVVGLFLLDDLSKLIEKKDGGLYRDDGLAVVKNATGPKLDKLRKSITKMFKDHGLAITIEIDLAITDFLDVTFDLKAEKFYPFRKPNNKPLYINAMSNHPPSIIKQLPKMVNKRISELSCDEAEFDKCKHTYSNALKESGHEARMSYESNPAKRRNRKRQVIWFNPPFSTNVKTNIGKTFLSLLKKHFPPHHKFRKIFNKNTVKISYSCMSNMASLIKGHNAKVLKKSNEITERLCNCRQKAQCPMDGKCLSSSIVYEATVTDKSETVKKYYGLSEGSFKIRHGNHKKAFKDRKYENDTELSKYVWKLKDKEPLQCNTELPPGTTITWSIAARAQPYQCGTRRCDLCLTEKMLILHSDPEVFLNNRNEVISKCRHKNKFKLKNYKT